MKLELPDYFQSPCGPVKVTLIDNLHDSTGRLGESIFFPDRSISIQSGMDEATTHATYWHEVLHFFLFDSGFTRLLPRRLEEPLCDAFGTFMYNMLSR